MPIVSLIVEALRARPVAVFWFATLAQALLWFLVPLLFYQSPPGDLARTLAIGREWPLGSWQGPPLAFWLAEMAYRAAGARVAGVYLLAQICVVAAYWAVFTLARRLVGTQHAALAVLLMSGVIAFSMPTPEFGPAVLALPLTAVALLLFWRALGEHRRGEWLALGVVLGLLLLTTYWALLLFALMALFLVATQAGRDALRDIDPWASAVLAVLITLPHIAWMRESGMLASARALLPTDGLTGRIPIWPLLLLGVLALHGGLLVLVALAAGWRSARTAPVPEIDGYKRKPLARRFVLFFAIGLPVAGTLVAASLEAGGTALWAAPLVVLSGLAVIVAAGPRIAIHRQHIVGWAWVAVLGVPPMLLAGALLIAPSIGAYAPDTGQPAAAMGQFFTNTFRRRTGQPLPFVVGDRRAAYLVALGSADRPQVYSLEHPERTPWVQVADVRRRGAIVIWNVVDSTARPPAAVLRQFPDLVAEVPQSFARSAAGFAKPLRLGWGMIRPQPSESPAADGSARQ